MLVVFILLSLISLVCGSNDLVNSTSLMQATWLPVSYGFTSESTVYDMMADLKKEGVRRVYVDVWNQGKIYFLSPTMQSVIGSSGIGADYLAWTLAAGNSLGLEVYAWFEYGLMCSYGEINNDFAHYAQANKWIIGQESGFYWLDPRNADVLSFTRGIMMDAISGYTSLGLKGVQWDDHFGTPVSLGRTISDMDNAMKYMSDAVKSSTTKSIMSLSPSTLSTSKGTYNVDWNKWGDLNYYDEVIPQIYRTTYDSFKSEFDYTLSVASSATLKKWTAAGIRVDGSGSPTPWSDVNNMIWYSNAKGRGASVWYAHGILELYPSQFQNIWG